MTQELVPANMALPAHLRNAGALVQANSAAMGGIGGGSYPRLSIRGSRFRLLIDGEETVLDLTELKVVILAANPNLSKMYFDKAYDANNDEHAPICYSNDGLRPDARAEKPQAADCASCANNVWGSKITPSGSKTKLCADSKRIALMASDQLDGEIVGLNIPAASLKNLRNYVAKLDERGIPVVAVETVLSFDTDQSFPMLQMRCSRFLEQPEFDIVQQRVKEDIVQVVTGTKAQAAAAAPLPAGVPPVATVAPSPPPVVTPPPVVAAPQPAAEPAKLKRGFGKAKATTAAPAPAQAAAPAAAAPQPVQAAAVVEASEPDAGMAAELSSLLEGLSFE